MYINNLNVHLADGVGVEVQDTDFHGRVGHPLCEKREYILNLRRRTVKSRRPGRARNEGSTGPKGLDNARCTYNLQATNEFQRTNTGQTLRCNTGDTLQISAGQTPCTETGFAFRLILVDSSPDRVLNKKKRHEA